MIIDDEADYASQDTDSENDDPIYNQSGTSGSSTDLGTATSPTLPPPRPASQRTLKM